MSLLALRGFAHQKHTSRRWGQCGCQFRPPNNGVVPVPSARTLPAGGPFKPACTVPACSSWHVGCGVRAVRVSSVFHPCRLFFAGQGGNDLSSPQGGGGVTPQTPKGTECQPCPVMMSVRCVEPRVGALCPAPEICEPGQIRARKVGACQSAPARRSQQ